MPPIELRKPTNFPQRYGSSPGFGVALHEGKGDPPPGSATAPGPPLVLVRGQPVRITLENHLAEPTSIHWHGIELESYYDGVAGLSGSPGHLAPAIPPGGTFVAEFTPPRAGTFIYHSHMDDAQQLGSGLYGAIVVLEPGQKFDPQIDRVMLFGQRGPSLLNPPVLNGATQPPAMELRAGTKYRLRLINIAPDFPYLKVALLNGETPVRWRALGKDGAALPAAQAVLKLAELSISVGETYDFEYESSAPAELHLVVSHPVGFAPEGRAPNIVVRRHPEMRMDFPVHVR